MNTRTFDALTRHAATVSRRGSLRLLSGAALAGALAAPGLAGAGKTGKKAKQQAAKRCKQQGGQCRAFFEDYCVEAQNPPECESTYAPCCEQFTRCNGGAVLECLFSIA